MQKKIFDIRSAYGQLILLVFIPICIMAAVGSRVVYTEVMETNRNEQKALAQALLLRYEPIVTAHLPIILSDRSTTADFSNQETKTQNKHTPSTTSSFNPNSQLHNILYRVQAEKELLRVAIINEYGQIILSTGIDAESPWLNELTSYDDKKNKGEPTLTKDFISGISTKVGTAYGLSLGEFDLKLSNLPNNNIISGNNTSADIQKLWLFVDMDNQPVKLAEYRIALALVLTALSTLLLLLLSLNIYSRHWIAPVYEMRLHLQNTNIDTLLQPMNVRTEGELGLLQQDLLLAFERIDGNFQELKSHAEQTEDDLRQAFDEMEMQNISIRNARDRAVSTSQAKSAFLANISHELRTPLNSIDGFINLLARHGSLSSEQDLYVQTIRKSSAHLLALVNDVLDFSKIEAGKLVLDSHEFELYTAIYDVVDMLSPLASEKGLRMGVLVYNDVPLNIIGDTLRVKQVLTNLVANAIKFTDTGDILVRVSLDDGMDDFLHIAVQDTGRGVPEQDREQLFKSFSQGDPSITRQYGGTGLGLVISKQLTRLMGGDIGYYDNSQENIDNHGSTFWFSVPAHVDVLEVQNAGDIVLPTLEKSISHSSKNALINTDTTQNNTLQILAWINHPASIQVLQASLLPLDIKITQSYSLAGTLEQLKENANHWDWVIVDSDANIRATEVEDDMTALLKQIRLHYQGRLAVYGYQMALDMQLLNRYKAFALHEPLDKRQLYTMLDKNRKAGNQNTPKDIERWKGHRILAVDDHLPNLLVLDALLAEQGIEVVTANSGFDAIQIISETLSQQLDNHDEHQQVNKIDLIFMDIQMPRMSGHETSQQIRKIEGTHSHIPIIALTAHGMSDERDKLMKSGIDDYVGKPISQPQLIQILQKWLGRKIQTNEGETNDSTISKSNTPHFPEKEVLKETDIQSSDNQTETEETQALAIIDWEDALTRSANKPDLASKLIIMMIDSINDEKQALLQAWQTQNLEQLIQVSHRILGASRYAGVPQLRHASESFENICRSQLNKYLKQATDVKLMDTRYQALMNALDNLANIDLTPWSQLRYHRLDEDDMAWKMI